MNQHRLYPTLSAMPPLGAPLARCQAFLYGVAGATRKFLVLPSRVLATAGLLSDSHVNVAVIGDRVLVAKDIPGTPRALTGGKERGAILQLTVGRLPESLHAGAVLVAGNGYTLLVPLSAAAEFEHLPEFEKHEGFLNEEAIVEVKAPVPAMPALFWRELKATSYGRAQRCVDVTGNVWSAAGFELDSPLRITRYQDGVLIERTTSDAANSQLRSKLARGKRAYGGKRFGRSILAGIEGTAIRVIAMDGKLALVGAGRQLSDFGLSAKHQQAYNTPATPAAASQVGIHSSVISIDRTTDSAKLVAAWLKNYGFTPGSRYTVMPHPTVSHRVVAVLDANGALEVRSNPSRKSGVELTLPMTALSDLSGSEMQIVGSTEGLQIEGREEAAYA